MGNLAKQLKLKSGDIIGFSGAGFVASFIQVATFGWPSNSLSHVGIMARNTPDGHLLFFESTSLMPDEPRNYCELQHRLVSGVQAHSIEQALTRPGKAWVYRVPSPLSPKQSRQLTQFLLKQIGREYDMKGCLRAGGGKVRARLRQLITRENSDQWFCSELCAAAINTFWPGEFSNSSVWSPNSFCRHIVSDGIVLPAERIH